MAFIIFFLLFALLSAQSANKNQSVQGSAVQAQATQSANQQLQNCLNQTHQRWDAEVALSEGTPGNAGDFDKSQRDLELAGCHQQYGY